MLTLLKKYNGLIFDVIQFILGSFLFYFLGLRLKANVTIVNGSLSAGGDAVTIIILVLIVLAQPAGAILLKDTIQNYYKDPEYRGIGTPGFIFLIFVIIMHFVFFAMMVMDIFINIGIDYNQIFEDHGFLVDIPFGIFLFICCTLPTAIVLLILIPDKKKESVSSFAFLKSLTGDLIISFSAFAFISIYWDNLFAELAADVNDQTAGIKTAIIILFFFLFLMIYLPPRLVYLPFDYNRLFTWIRILIVYFPFFFAVVS